MSTEKIIETIQALPLSQQLRVAAEIMYAIDRQNRVTGPHLLPREHRIWSAIEQAEYEIALNMLHGDDIGGWAA
jgi:hypothetical protein